MNQRDGWNKAICMSNREGTKANHSARELGRCRMYLQAYGTEEIAIGDVVEAPNATEHLRQDAGIEELVRCAWQRRYRQ